MIKNWLLYIGGLTGAVVFYIFYFGWYSWFILILALCLPWFSLLVSLPAMLQAQLKLHIPQSCSKGEEAFVTMRIAGGSLPMPVCRVGLEVRCSLSGSYSVIKRTARGRSSDKFPLDTEHCGVLRCSMKSSRVYDYLGLFGLPIRGGASAEVVVEPCPVPPEQLPDLLPLFARNRKPKPGGGFSEEHELRDYRPGDSLRDIHWKLSAKMDSLILREAQEPVPDQILLTFDLCGAGDSLDSVLAQLVWLSNWFLEHERAHQVLWIDPADGKATSVQIQSREDQQPMLRRVLGSTLRADIPSIEERRFPAASWRYHVLPEQEVQQ